VNLGNVSWRAPPDGKILWHNIPNVFLPLEETNMPLNIEGERTFTVREMGYLLGISTDRIYRAYNRGQLHSVPKVPGITLRFAQCEVERWAEIEDLSRKLAEMRNESSIFDRHHRATE
jgi:predicted DNA-binding transcriptional regulator AlpA